MHIFFPTSLEELWRQFEQYPAGQILAGGTDLLVRLRKSGEKVPVLFALEKLPNLQTITQEQDGLFIGAGVTIQQLLEHEIIQKRFRALWEALNVFASPPIRHCATLGGNLCTASPAGDTLAPLYVFGAVVVVASVRGLRRVPIVEFILGPGSTVLQPGEIVTGVSLPLPAEAVQSHYYKVGKRQALAIAVVSLAVLLELGQDNRLNQIKLAWGSVGKTIVMLPEVEAFLKGKVLTTDVLRQAAKLAADGVSPINDVRAGAAYRRQVAGNLLLSLSSHLQSR
ncbi:MAG: molybdopterin dehydrogenase FAD-binding protein [Firmicutes bacterium]|nr:molybdopterin dehydrogenase FAD-binding protein [Bacillota bacterium]